MAKDPPLSVVRKFVHLLEQSPLDLQEEQEFTRLREEVVTNIRSNQQMEKDLNMMDIKIGLLVKNRITLQVSSTFRISVMKARVKMVMQNWNCIFVLISCLVMLPVYFGSCFVFLKDVVSHNKKMNTKKVKSEMDLTTGDKLGIKGLSKGKRRKLEAYQHLFYLLQVIQEMFQVYSHSILKDRCPFNAAVLICLFIDKPKLLGQTDLSDAPK